MLSKWNSGYKSLLIWTENGIFLQSSNNINLEKLNFTKYLFSKAAEISSMKELNQRHFPGTFQWVAAYITV